jgi:hypothetical protein
MQIAMGNWHVKTIANFMRLVTDIANVTKIDVKQYLLLLLMGNLSLMIT